MIVRVSQSLLIAILLLTHIFEDTEGIGYVVAYSAILASMLTTLYQSARYCYLRIIWEFMK